MAFGPHVELAAVGSSTATTFPVAAGTRVNVGGTGVAVNFVVDSVGASPSVTFKVQGSVDSGTTWFDVPSVFEGSGTQSGASVSMTAVGSAMLYLTEPWPWLRVNVTAVNNVVFHAYAYPISTSSPVVSQTRPLGFTGSAWEPLRVANVFKDLPGVAITAGTPVTVWTPAAGKRYRVLGFYLSASNSSSFIFKVGGVESWRTPTGSNSVTTPANFGNGRLAVNANDVLQLDLANTGTVNGFVFGVEE